jgi:hypothetical protein
VLRFCTSSFLRLHTAFEVASARHLINLHVLMIAFERTVLHSRACLTLNFWPQPSQCDWSSPVAERNSVSKFLTREKSTVDRRWHNREPLTCLLSSRDCPAESHGNLERTDFKAESSVAFLRPVSSILLTSLMVAT